MMMFRVIVARCQSESEAEVVDGGEIGIVGEDAQDFGGGDFAPASGIDTVSVFPKNSAKCKQISVFYQGIVVLDSFVGNILHYVSHI